MNHSHQKNRLEVVASQVSGGARVADVGADHGLLALRLIRSDRAVHCIVSDRDPRALSRARRRLSRVPPGRVDLRLGDGFSVLRLEDRVDTVVLAGLGARSIIRILDDDRLERLGVLRLVLQPQSEPALLRRWLVDHRLAIVGEQVARERGRFYEVIAAEVGAAATELSHPRLDRDCLLEAGPCLVRARDPQALAMWSRRARELGVALERSRGGSSEAQLEGRLRRARAIVAALSW